MLLPSGMINPAYPVYLAQQAAEMQLRAKAAAPVLDAEDAEADDADEAGAPVRHMLRRFVYPWRRRR
jgi:hypothetical protein